MTPTAKDFKKFQETMWSYYREHGRQMPWRDKPTPYYVVVSEIMLQQTQVSRVIGKFNSFIKKFPDWKALARASVKEVLEEWSGLGYNRRALYLKRVAETVVALPSEGDITDLLYAQRKDMRLPGIGPNTAGSILAFAFNRPTVFIETNIRSVYIHFFFYPERSRRVPEIEKKEGKKACKKISDDQLIPLIEKTVDQKNPREWYYALMDYGASLKSTLPNPSRRSKHHIKQKPFKGSNRELRSKMLQLIMKTPSSNETVMKHFIALKYQGESVMRNVQDLMKEGFIVVRKNKLRIV